jgi:transcriptional regulator NrdR family protein
MTKQVIKSDGSKEPYDAKKITGSITRAAQDAKLAPAEINMIVSEISDTVMQFMESKDEVMSSEIRDLVLMELDRINPIVSAEWRRFMNSR